MVKDKKLTLILMVINFKRRVLSKVETIDAFLSTRLITKDKHHKITSSRATGTARANKNHRQEQRTYRIG
jgi:hypothetical protein